VVNRKEGREEAHQQHQQQQVGVLQQQQRDVIDVCALATRRKEEDGENE